MVRLTSACFISAAVHLLCLLSVPVNLTGGMPGIAASVIDARLAPASASENPADAATVAPAEAAEASLSDTTTEAPPPEPVAQPKPEPASAQALSSPSAGIDLPLIRDPTYYPAKQLDVYPEPLVPIRLQYPDSALADQVNGRLLLLILIDEFGVVNDVSAVEAEPPGYFEETAGAVFRDIRFKPAMRQGHAVKCRVLVQVRFTYGESEGAVN